MNDMFDNLKELKQKLKSEESDAKKSARAKKVLDANENDKEGRLKMEFQEFMEGVDIQAEHE
jgi:hypothetical protein